MQRNFVVFILLSALIMGGWLYLQSVTRPERKADDPKPADAKVAPKAPDRPLTPAERAAVGRYAGLPAQLAAGAGGPWPLVFGLGRAHGIEPPAPAPPPTPAVAAPPPKAAEAATVTLGGRDHHLEVLLTAHGAGVRRVTLTRFRAADWLGRPTTAPLDLVQDDPVQPSFLMYHFHDPKDPRADYPVFGLDGATWALEAKNLAADGIHTATFSTAVPGQPHLKVVKTYRLAPQDYHVGLALTIRDERPAVDAEPSAFRYQLAGAHGLPIEGEWYTSVTRSAAIALVDSSGVWRELGMSHAGPQDAAHVAHRDGGERIPEGDRGATAFQYGGVVTPSFGALVVVDNEQPDRKAGGVDRANIIAWARATHESYEKKGTIVDVSGDQLAFRAGEKVELYHLLPRAKEHLQKDLGLGKGDAAVITYYTAPDGRLIAAWARNRQTLRPQLEDLTVRVNSEVVTLRPQSQITHQFLLYHGPVKTSLLQYFTGDNYVPPDQVARYSDTLHLRTLTEYRSPGWPGRFAEGIYLTKLIIYFTNLMHWLLIWLHTLTSFLGEHLSWGLSIILLTVIVRGAMFPISRRAAMFSVKMQEIQPEMKKIQERYKNDPAGKTQAMMELHRKHGINPVGSCLPLLLQMPVFLGLYFALQESIFFRLAPFLWIRNLAAPDMLFWWSEHIPLISDPDNQAGGFLSFLYLGPYFNLLPLIAAAVMTVQQIMMTPPPVDEQQAQQQAMMRFMPAVIAVLFYKVAAGLALYFIASSLWGLAERKLLPKKKPADFAAATPATAAAGPKAPYKGGTPNGGARRGGKGGGPARGKEKADPNALDKVKEWWAEVLKQAKKK